VSVGSPFSGAWTASDPSGIAHYDTQVRQLKWNDNEQPNFSNWKMQTTATTATLRVNAGRTVCAQVRAQDNSGNRSGWTQACTAVPLQVGSIQADSRWTKNAAAGAYGGRVARTTQLGATLTRTGVRTERLGILVTKCPGCGSVRVRWNGTALGTYSLAATTLTRSVPIEVGTWPSGASGTVTIEVTTSGKTVEIEGLVAYRD
jgi:hypothetical protein